MPNLRGSELLILLLVIVVLFGAKRLPDAARGIGRSMRIFKAETKGLSDSETTKDAPAPAAVEQSPQSTSAEAPSGQPVQDAQPQPRA